MAISEAESIALALCGERSGKGWICRCPVIGHGQGRGDIHPSLSVSDGRTQLLVNCHAKCDPIEVLRSLNHRGLLQGYAATKPIARPVATCPPEPDPKALAIWHSAAPAIGTVVETYLQRRGIIIPPPRSIRFGIANDYGGMPTMIAAVHRPDGTIVAIQRTFLTEAGEKANIDPPRRITGGLQGGAVCLALPDKALGIAEGIEDALAAMQLAGVPCWATLGAGQMRKVTIPGSVRELHIFADDDEAGRKAAELTISQHIAQGRRVHLRYPPHGHKDWASIIDNNNSKMRAA